MEYIVIVQHNGGTWPLKGTVWAFAMERAQRFPTIEAAAAALEKTKKYTKPAIYKKARIIPAPAMQVES